MSGDEAYEEWLRDATDEEVAKEFGVGEQYQRPLIENFQEPVFDEARKHDEVDSYDIDSGLSVVQRTQIREALKLYIQEAFDNGKDFETDRFPAFIDPKRYIEVRTDQALSAIGLILGDKE